MAWKKIPERALDLSRAVMIDEGPSSVAAIASDASRKKTSMSWWQREVWVYEPSAENMSLRPIFQISKHAKRKLFFQKLLVNNACFLKFWKISYRDIFSAAGSQMFWDRGTPVACCRKLSQRLIEKVEPGSTSATACIATWDAKCIATWETRDASWALANHVCFPLVALDLR